LSCPLCWPTHSDGSTGDCEPVFTESCRPLIPQDLREDIMVHIAARDYQAYALSA
jgi:hypothetical protein